MYTFSFEIKIIRNNKKAKPIIHTSNHDKTIHLKMCNMPLIIEFLCNKTSIPISIRKKEKKLLFIDIFQIIHLSKRTSFFIQN